MNIRVPFAGFSRPFGTCGMPNPNPAVNCRAILESPSGRGKQPSPFGVRGLVRAFGRRLVAVECGKASNSPGPLVGLRISGFGFRISNSFPVMTATQPTLGAQPQRGCGPLTPHGHNPVGVEMPCSMRTQGSLRQPWAGGRNAVGVLRVGRVAPRAPFPARQTARAERRALPTRHSTRAERRALPTFALRISFGFRASDFGFES